MATNFTSEPYETAVYPSFPHFPMDTFENKNINIMSHTLFPYIQMTLSSDILNYKDMCMGLKKDYIEDSLMDGFVNVIVVVGKKTPALYRVIGLALIQLDQETFEIDVLCGSSEIKGIGTHLIERVKEIGRRFGKKELTLSSVTDALGFYTKQGFECEPLCPMKLEIKDALFQGGKPKFTRRRKHTKRKRSKSKKRT
jgi:GNAT superfamily N-acetyltransferase